MIRPKAPRSILSMRRRHSAAAVALGAALTTGALAIGSTIGSPGIGGHQLIDGAENVLRLSDTTATTTVATAPAKAIAERRAKTHTVKVKAHRARRQHATHARHVATAPTARRRGMTYRTTHRRRAVAPGPTTTSATPTAPVTTPAVTTAPAAADTVATAPATPTVKPSRAGLKVTAASVGTDGNVHVRLAVSQADAAAASALPDQLDVNVDLAALARADGATGPMALDTALDLVPDPSQSDGVRLRMRMQLAPSASAAPAAPAEDPNGLSNVVTVHLAVPTGGVTSTPPGPTPTPVAQPVEVQLPIAPADPASQTVQLPVPPASDGGDSQPAVPVAVTVTPVDTTPAQTAPIAPTAPTDTTAPTDPTAPADSTQAPADSTPAPAGPTA